MKVPITYGDVITCRIDGNAIVPVMSKSFDIELKFKVIGYSFDDQFYILHVPKYYNIKNSWKIERRHVDEFCIRRAYLNELAMAVKQDKIVSYTNVNNDGMHCDKCKQFFHMAEANQENGTLICWSCRQNPYRIKIS